MSDAKKLTPAETMRAIQEEAARDAVEEIQAMSPSEVDAELREAGVEPDEAAARAKAAIEAALAKAEPGKKGGAAADAPAGGPAGGPAAPAKVVSLDAAQARRSGWAIGALAAAAAAAVVVMATRGRDENLVGAGRPSPAEERAAALAACDRKDYEACERRLDDMKEYDPAGEDDARVKAARAAIARWRESHPNEAPKPAPN